MYYLTFNDLPGGVYRSQVIDVVAYLNSLDNSKVRLIAVIPIRGFWKNLKQIRSSDKNAIVLPIPLKLKFWKITRFYFKLIPGFKRHTVIARGPMACSLALKVSSKVIYDGRAAVSAELDEFSDMVRDITLTNQIKAAEAESVKESIFQLAVSRELINYWKTHLSYSGKNHAVIPCLLPESRELHDPAITRSSMGISENDVVLVFSGGSGGWQSSQLLMDLLENQLSQDNVKVILLTKTNDLLTDLIRKFTGKVILKWVPPNMVKNYLDLGDYGILLRDQITTNRVASPVKFAEYLRSGLKVLISPNLGDYSSFLVENDLGLVLENVTDEIKLPQISKNEKLRIIKIGDNYFTRKNYEDIYNSLFTL